MRRIRFDLFPEMNDVGIDGPGRDDDITPCLIEEVIPSHDFPFTFDEEFQKLEFQGCQMDFFSGF